MDCHKNALMVTMKKKTKPEEEKEQENRIFNYFIH